jgi:hypothetical protein
MPGISGQSFSVPTPPITGQEVGTQDQSKATQVVGPNVAPIKGYDGIVAGVDLTGKILPPNQIDAAAGSHGTPSASNPYVTASDPALLAGPAALNAALVHDLALLDPSVNPYTSAAGKGVAGDQGGSGFCGVLIVGGLPAVDNVQVFASSNVLWRWMRDLHGKPMDARAGGASISLTPAGNRAALQAAIDAVPEGGRILIPREAGGLHIDGAPLVVSKGIHIFGDHALGSLITQDGAFDLFQLAPAANGKAITLEHLQLYGGVNAVNWKAAGGVSYVSRLSSMRHISCGGQSNAGILIGLSMLGSRHEDLNLDTTGLYGLYSSGSDFLGNTRWSSVRAAGAMTAGLYLKQTNDGAEQPNVHFANLILEYNDKLGLYLYSVRALIAGLHCEHNQLNATPAVGLPDLLLDSNYGSPNVAPGEVVLDGGFFSTPSAGRQADGAGHNVRVAFANSSCRFVARKTYFAVDDAIDGAGFTAGSGVELEQPNTTAPVVLNWTGYLSRRWPGGLDVQGDALLLRYYNGVERVSLRNGTGGNRGVLKLWDATAAAYRYLYMDNNQLVVSDAEPT